MMKSLGAHNVGSVPHITLGLAPIGLALWAPRPPHFCPFHCGLTRILVDPRLSGSRGSISQDMLGYPAIANNPKFS